MIKTLRRWKNKVRMWYLETFTDRIKRTKIKDEETGKEHEIITETTMEKLCDHKTITEIAPTMWKCKGCDDVYFQIGYKVLLDQQQLVDYLGTIADHLKLKIKNPADNA